MESIYTVSVTEALEQLSYPSFFDRSERKAAYDRVMLWGMPDERISAQIAKLKYPFDEPEEFISPSKATNFSIASKVQHA